MVLLHKPVEIRAAELSADWRHLIPQQIFERSRRVQSQQRTGDLCFSDPKRRHSVSLRVARCLRRAVVSPARAALETFKVLRQAAEERFQRRIDRTLQDRSLAGAHAEEAEHECQRTARAILAARATA